MIKHCPTNELYGHAEILRRYCGVQTPTPIPGRLQHGWTTGYAEALTWAGDRLAPDAPLYVWSDRTWRALPPEMQRRTHRIGAPWLYMGVPKEVHAATAGLLAVPSHSIRTARIIGSWEEYADALEDLARRERLATVSVCLHAEDEAVAPVFCRRGFRVFACGGVSDSQFLYWLRTALRAHEVVTTNRISTVAWYAARLGRRVVLGGPPMATTNPDESEQLTGDAAWVAREFPCIDAATAKLELGADFMWTPSELRSLLWRQT